MEFNFIKRNPKALQLGGLDSITKKVTVGFKCHAKIKLQLAKDAHKYGLTLSEYVENLLLDLDNASQQETNENFELKKMIGFYENDILKNLFTQYENQEFNFKNTGGSDLKIKVKELKDIYTIIINSYKINK